MASRGVIDSSRSLLHIFRVHLAPLVDQIFLWLKYVYNILDGPKDKSKQKNSKDETRRRDEYYEY